MSTDSTLQVYQAYPYPSSSPSTLVRRGSRIASLEWILAMGRPQASLPCRVLVAGCGTGAEAFNLRRRLPAAQIIAVDYSSRSIVIARRVQETRQSFRDIQFLTLDLERPDFVRTLSTAFDLITCHGVLSYVRQPATALRHL